MFRNAVPTIRRVVWVSFLVDLLDIFLNLSAAIISGSIILLTEVLQGVADLIASGLLLLGVYRSDKKADREYQFGYGRDLFLWVLVSAVCTFVLAGALSFWFGLERYIHPQHIEHINLSLLVLAIALGTNLYAFILSIRRLFSGQTRGRFKHFIDSSKVETKTTFFLDLTGSAAAFFGLVSLVLLRLLHNDRFDGIGAMLIGLSMAALAIFIVKDARSLLIGRAATKQEERLIRRTALTIEGVRSVEDLRTMYLGSDKLLVNLEVNLDPKLHTRQIEKIMDLIKADIKNQLPNVVHIQVEIESAS